MMRLPRLPLLWALLSMARGDPQNVNTLYNGHLNKKISDNGSLIISSVTAKHAGRYSVTIQNSTGSQILKDEYRLHVEGEIFAWPGSEVLLPVTIQLPLTSADKQSCHEVKWKYGESGDKEIAVIRRCRHPEYNRNLTNMKISENGSLIISPVTAEHAGRYRVTIINSTGRLIHSEYYRLHVEAPLSVPVISVSCLPNSSAEIFCKVENGTDPSITLTINGTAEKYHKISSHHINITMPVMASPSSVTCSVKNDISNSSAIRALYVCPAPLSVPVISVSCLPDGSAEISCKVEKGTDPYFTLTINGTTKEYHNISSHHINITVPVISSPSNVTCSVTNSISNNSAIRMLDDCPVPLSVPDISVSCLPNGSAEIFCKVEKGTDPSITLTINGTAEEYHNISSHHVRITVPVMTSPSNVTCSVTNSISNNSAEMLDACTELWYSFLKKSIIRGSVFLILISSIYIFAYWYTRRNMRKDAGNLAEKRGLTNHQDATQDKKINDD